MELPIDALCKKFGTKNPYFSPCSKQIQRSETVNESNVVQTSIVMILRRRQNYVNIIILSPGQQPIWIIVMAVNM